MTRLGVACRDFEFDDAAVRLVFPPQELCTGGRFPLLTDETLAHFRSSWKDNAVMIGWAAMHRFLAQDYDEYEIGIRPKWNIEELQ